jgi:DNA-directed RNA polymerase delta subunit
MSDKEYEALIADFFTSLTTDKRFILLNSVDWDLKENHVVNIVIDESEEDFEENYEDLDESVEKEDEFDIDGDGVDDLGDEEAIDDEEELDDIDDLEIIDEDAELEE